MGISSNQLSNEQGPSMRAQLQWQARLVCLVFIALICSDCLGQSPVPPEEIRLRYPDSRIIRQESHRVGAADIDFYLIRERRGDIVARVPKDSREPIAYAHRGDLLVTLKPGKTRADLQVFLNTRHIRFSSVRQLGKRNVFLLGGSESRNPWLLVDSLANDALFSSLEVNQILLLSPNQHGVIIPYDQWSLDYFAGAQNYADDDTDTDGAEMLSRLKFWSGPALQQVVVAVTDSGIARNHPALKNRQWVNPKEIPANGKDDDGNGKIDDVNGWNFLARSKNIDDRNGHGTHVAGVIAAEQPLPGAMVGIAANVKIMTLKISEQSDVTLSAAVEAVDYAVGHGAKVINMSWGGFTFSPALDTSIRDARAANVFMVAAAGNNLPGQPPVDISLKPTFPCMMQVALCIAATNQRGQVASYSNYSTGPGVFLLGAPGSAILSTISTTASGYGVLSGTSMATPHVAGTAALLVGIYPGSDIAAVRNRLFDNSDVIADAGPFNVRLRLNIYRSVTAPVNPLSSDPATYCNTAVEHEPRHRRGPFANSFEPGIDGNSEVGAYTICSARQLLAISSQLDAGRKYFKLVQNIDWNELHESERQRIGTVAQPFQGIFDGQGFALRNYTFISQYRDAGLFAKIGPQGSVRNFRMTNVRLTGADNVGALAGQNEGVINNVQVEGVISGRNNVGGIVGATQLAIGYPSYTGKLVNVFFEGRVTGDSNVAGISGQLFNYASIELAFAKGVVAATADARLGGVAGGIVGTVGYGATVDLSHAQVRTSGDVAGGAVGHLKCHARVSNTYTERAVEGATAGGLIGSLENAFVQNSYSLSYSSGGQHVGGLVGKNSDDQRNIPPDTFVCSGTAQRAPPSEIRLAYYLNEQNSPGAGGDAKSLYELRQRSTFEGWNFAPRYWLIQVNESPALNLLPRTRMSRY